MVEKKIRGLRSKVLMIITLVAIGITLGSVFVYATHMNGTSDTLELEFVDGKVILDAEGRELLKENVLNITLENDQIKALIAGKDYTTQVTLVIPSKTLEEAIANGSLLDSFRRIYIDFNKTAVVTLTFEDGSGYNVPVNWEEWTVGKPEYSDQVSPPESAIRIRPIESTERQRE